MQITKDYLDKLIEKNTKQNGEIASIYIDFEHTNIDIVNVIDSNNITDDKLTFYEDIIKYYFTLISNSSDFFEDLEQTYNNEIIIFNSIKLDFLNNNIEFDINTYNNKTKDILTDYFTKYQQEFNNNNFQELYNINIIKG